MTADAKIPVGISACLLGDNVRYDGGNKFNLTIEQTLADYLEFHRFCPEVDIGLGVPRNAIRLLHKNGNIICTDSADETLDHTQKLRSSAEAQLQWLQGMCGYIFKSRSPSCGLEVNVYSLCRGKAVVSGSSAGIFADTVTRSLPWLPVVEEDKLADETVRGSFVRRICALYRWQQTMADGLTVARFTDYHARQKLILLAHCQKTYRQMGPLVASANRNNLSQVAEQYLLALMDGLKKPATPGDHLNVLLHIQGYLSDSLPAAEKASLREYFDRYLQGQAPLQVPVDSLNQLFQRYPNEYISRCWYLHPHPAETRSLVS